MLYRTVFRRTFKSHLVPTRTWLSTRHIFSPTADSV